MALRELASLASQNGAPGLERNRGLHDEDKLSLTNQ